MGIGEPLSLESIFGSKEGRGKDKLIEGDLIQVNTKLSSCGVDLFHLLTPGKNSSRSEERTRGSTQAGRSEGKAERESQAGFQSLISGPS